MLIRPLGYLAIRLEGKSWFSQRSIRTGQPTLNNAQPTLEVLDRPTGSCL